MLVDTNQSRSRSAATSKISMRERLSNSNASLLFRTVGSSNARRNVATSKMSNSRSPSMSS